MSEGLVFDREAALDRVGGDTELLVELIGIFREQWPSQREAIDRAVGVADAPKIASAAHSLKSAAGNVGAMRGYHLALDLEKSAKAGEPLAGLAEKAAALREAVDSFLAEVEDFAG